METSSSKPKAWLWLCVLVPLAAVGTVALLLGLGLVFNASGQSEPLRSDERALLLDIDHLARWTNGYVPDVHAERVSKTRFFDGSYAIEYVYDVSDDDSAPYLTYTVTFERSEDDAEGTYLSFWGGTEVGFFVGDGDFDVRESNELFRWGDTSRFSVLTTEGRPFGNVFVARRGRRVVYFLLSGVYFDDAESIDGLLSPYLEELERSPLVH